MNQKTYEGTVDQSVKILWNILFSISHSPSLGAPFKILSFKVFNLIKLDNGEMGKSGGEGGELTTNIGTPLCCQLTT